MEGLIARERIQQFHVDVDAIRMRTLERLETLKGRAAGQVFDLQGAQDQDHEQAVLLQWQIADLLAELQGDERYAVELKRLANCLLDTREITLQAKIRVDELAICEQYLPWPKWFWYHASKLQHRH
ncbi:hypothetical protein LUCX_17 [Xanthomonas phage vB_XciM_LucasX]|nr:hypothetical protein LUCX_17 [Xanthomonas phage vB_XciM_LucasX]